MKNGYLKIVLIVLIIQQGRKHKRPVTIFLKQPLLVRQQSIQVLT